MPYLLIAARKDLQRRLADVPALAIWLGIPIAVGFMMFLVSGSGSSPAVPKAKVLLVDRDDSFVSRLVGNSATSGRLGEFLDVERVSLEEGERRMADGEASAMIVLPEGFDASVLEETPAEIQLVTNPSQRLLPGIVEEGLEILVEAIFYAQRLFGGTLRDFAAVPDTGPSNEEVTRIAVAVNERIRALEDVLLPPVLTLRVADGDEAGATTETTPNFGLLFVPGLLLMSVLFIAQGASGDLWREKQLGTLRRTRALPGSTVQFLGGKVLAGTALVGAVAIVAIGVVWLMFGVPATRLPLAWAWTCLAGVAMLCYFGLLQVMARSERGAQLLGTMIVFPLIMIGGSFFPFEAMPPWMAALGARTPNGLAVLQLREILDGRAAWLPLVTAALAIGLPAAAAFWVTTRRLDGRFPVD